MNVESQWLFTLDDFDHTPSAEDGWTVQQQFDERAKAVDFMFRVGMTLLLCAWLFLAGCLLRVLIGVRLL